MSMITQGFYLFFYCLLSLLMEYFTLNKVKVYSSKLRTQCSVQTKLKDFFRIAKFAVKLKFSNQGLVGFEQNRWLPSRVWENILKLMIKQFKDIIHNYIVLYLPFLTPKKGYR